MADTRKLRLAVELTGEETFKKGLHEIDTGLKNVKAAQANLDSEFGKGDKSLSRLIQQHELLEKKLKLQKQKLEEIRKEHKKVAEAQGEDSDAAQKLAREMQYAQAAANKTEKDISGLGKEIDKATSRTQRFKDELAKGENALQKVGSKVTALGSKLTKSFTLPIAAAAGVCVNSFMQFEDSMANVATIADTTSMSMEDLQKQALKVSDATGLAATEIAAGAYQAISAGVDTAESMKFMEAAAKAAKAGMSDVSTVVNGSTSIMNAWNISASEATSVFEKMIIAQNLGKTSLGELSSNIGQLTGLAPSLGVAFEEVLSATAALTKNGVGTSQAMNGLKAIFSGILKPTAEASKEAERLGLEFSAAALKSKGLTLFLQDINDKTRGSEDSLAKLFGSVEGLSQVMLLGGAAASDYSTALASMASSAGALDAAFETRTSSRTEQMTMALNKLNNEGIKLGESVAPLIDLGANAISKLADIMNSLTPAQQQTLLTIAAVLAAIGPLTAGIGKIVSALGGIKKAFSALSALTGTFSLWIIGITAVIAAIVKLKEHLEGVSTEKQLSVAFSNVTVDTKKIDEALEAAEKMEHEIKITADAKIKLKQTSEEINAQILELLNPTTSQEEIHEKVNIIVQPVYDEINADYENRKKALDEALKNGAISDTEYTELLEQASVKAQSIAKELNTAATEYVNLLASIAQNGEAATPEQIDTLEELRTKIDNLITSTRTAKVEFQGNGLNDYIKDWLTNGKSKTSEDKAEITAMIDDTFQPVIDGIQTKFDSAKAGLDLLLSAGLITLTDYNTRLSELNGNTEQATKEIETKKQSYVDYVMKAAESSSTATETDIANLNALMAAVIKEYEDFQTIDVSTKLKELEDYEQDILPKPLDKKTIDRKMQEWIEPIRNSILAESGVTAGAVLEAVSLTETEQAEIEQAALEGGSAFSDALQAYNVQDSVGTEVVAGIESARDAIFTTINSMELSDEQRTHLLDIMNEGGDVEAALLSYGIAPETAQTAATSIGNAWSQIRTAISSMSKPAEEVLKAVSLTETEQAEIEQAALEGSKAFSDALQAYNVQDSVGTEVVAGIESARDAIFTTINSMELSDEQRTHLLDIMNEGGDVEAALLSYGIAPETAQTTATSIDNAWSQIRTAISGMSKPAEGAGLDSGAQAQLDRLKSLTEEYTLFVDGLIARGGATDAEIVKLKKLGGEIDALGASYAGLMSTEAVKQLTESGDSLFAEVKAWLTDGWVDTETQQQDFKVKVDTWYQGVIDTINTSYAEKKASLDALLAAGFIDNTTYDAELNELTTKTAETKTALENEKTLFVSYMLELAQASTVPAGDQIARLEELKNNLQTKVKELGDIDFGTGKTLTDYVTTALTDGATVISETDKAEILKAVDGWIQPVFDSIESNYATKKAQLAAALSSGSISTADYMTELNQLKTDADAAKQALTEEANNYIAYVDTIGTQSGAALEEQYKRLDVLRQQVLTTAESILEANNTALLVAKASKTLIENNPEAATSREYAAAVKFISIDKENAELVAKENYEKTLAALQEEYDKATGKVERDEIVIKMQSAAESYSVNLEDIENEASVQMQAIIAAIASKYPELDEALKRMQKDLSNEFSNINDQDLRMSQREDAAEDYAKKIAFWTQQLESVYGEQYTDFVEDMSAAAGAGMLDMLTANTMDTETMNRIMGLNLFTDPQGVADARLYGGEMINGYVDGLYDNTGKTANAAISAAKAANDAFCKENEIQSPSKKWKRFGGHIIEGLNLGIGGATGGVLVAMRKLSLKLYTAGQASINGLIQGAQSRRSALVQAYTELAQAAITATQSRLKIASPSKVFTQIGEYSGEGMIRGLVNKTSAVQKAMVAMVSPNANVQASGQLANATQNTQVDAHRQNSVNITVNYTGAVTGRESRKLAQQLGGYLSQQLSSRGV